MGSLKLLMKSCVIEPAIVSTYNCFRTIRSTYDRIVSFSFKPSSIIIRTEEGSIPFVGKKRLCIFSHYDKDNIVDEYVLYYLNELKRLGFAIVFVSASKLHKGELEKVKRRVSKIILRKNRGRDFGAFRVGVHTFHDLKVFEQILFTNDSVYGPFYDLEKFFQWSIDNDMDIWGLTDSWEHRYHIQTYFFVFNNRAIKSPFFENFWKSVRFRQYRPLIIKEYELGLSKQAIRQGLKVGAVCNYLDLRRDLLGDDDLKKRVPNTSPVQEVQHRRDEYLNKWLLKNELNLSYTHVNPTHFMWKILITRYHHPFIKIDLIRDNPCKIPDLWEWKDVIEKTGYDTNLITKHLKRVFMSKRDWFS